MSTLSYRLAQEAQMSSITISVPDRLRDWIERRVASGEYGSAKDYLFDLIERDHDDVERRDELVDALRRGEESGISRRGVPDILADLRREASPPKA